MFRRMENSRDVLYFLSRKQYMKKVWSRGEIYQFCVNTRSFPTLLGKRKQSIVKKLTKFDGCFHENIPDRFESLRQLCKLWIFGTICASTARHKNLNVVLNWPSLFYFPTCRQIPHRILNSTLCEDKYAIQLFVASYIYVKINITRAHHF